MADSFLCKITILYRLICMLYRLKMLLFPFSFPPFKNLIEFKRAYFILALRLKYFSFSKLYFLLFYLRIRLLFLQTILELFLPSNSCHSIAFSCIRHDSNLSLGIRFVIMQLFVLLRTLYETFLHYPDRTLY